MALLFSKALNIPLIEPQVVMNKKQDIPATPTERGSPLQTTRELVMNNHHDNSTTLCACILFTASDVQVCSLTLCVILKVSRNTFISNMFLIC